MGNICCEPRESSQLVKSKLVPSYEFVIFGDQKKFDSIEDVDKAIQSSAAREGSLTWQAELLTKITLSGNSWGYEACEHMANLLKSTNAPKLRTIDFSDIFVGRLRAELPKSLNVMAVALRTRPLIEIDLSHNAFGPDGIRAFECLLREDTTLKVLKVNNCGLGPEGGEMIAEALEANHGLRLQVFHACRDRLENKGISALAKVFQKMGSLREIAVSQNGIKDEGMSNLFESLFECRSTLQTIRVNDNWLKAKAIEHLINLIINSSFLKELDISDLNMGEMSVIATVRALLYMHEMRCDFWCFKCNYNISDSKKVAVECLNTLFQIKSLETIDFEGNLESKKLQKEFKLKFAGKTIKFVGEDAEDEEDEDEEDEDEDEEEEEIDYSKLDSLIEKFPMLAKEEEKSFVYTD